ncbi:MAG: hypothetical protein HFJ85_01355 [Oscillospiraceae bacterium]|nr:hypothetical protein [Oscillospiraceae bacterium]
MNPFAVLSVGLIFLSFGCFLLAFFTRMKPYAKRTRLLCLLSAVLSLLAFMLWGIMRNL